MKYLKQITTLILASLILFGCKKYKVETTPLASLNIINAVVGGTSAKFGSRATTISTNGSTNYALVAGANDIYIYPSADSLHPYYNESKFSVSEGEAYSLFLTGTPGAIESIRIKEAIPYRIDSTAGIRFINLAPNKASINITLSTSTSVNEVSALPYKSYTEFKTYPAVATNTSYSFQVRDAANPGTVLATQTLSGSSLPRFANSTIVIRQNGASGLGVFVVKNDR